MSAAVLLKDVTKRFGSTMAVDHLDLAVPRGTLYGLIESAALPRRSLECRASDGL